MHPSSLSSKTQDQHGCRLSSGGGIPGQAPEAAGDTDRNMKIDRSMHPYIARMFSVALCKIRISFVAELVTPVAQLPLRNDPLFVSTEWLLNSPVTALIIEIYPIF